MPAHIPAAVGRGALPLVEKINNGKASKLDQAITDQPTRPPCNTLVFTGEQALWRETIATNKLEDQLTPRSGPQERIYAQPHPGRGRERGVLPLAEKINNGETSKLDQVITDQHTRPVYHFEKFMHSTFGLSPVTSR